MNAATLTEASMTRIVALLAMTAALGVTAAAHHSFAAYYFEDQSVSIEGAVTSFEYAAPHAWLHVTAPDRDGEMRRFAAEWANPARLTRDNVTKDTLKPGDRVIVTGSPGRTPSEYKLHLKRIVRPADGWSWTGSRR
jgi:hydrogenase maturation factor